VQKKAKRVSSDIMTPVLRFAFHVQRQAL